MVGSGALRGKLAALGAVIVCLLGAGAWIVVTHAPARSASAPRAAREAQPHSGAAARPAAAGLLRVVSVTPADHAAGISGTEPVRVVFSAALAAGSPLPTLRPAIAGRWQRVSATTIQFDPAQGFDANSGVRLRIPAGQAGLRSVTGQLLAAAQTVRFHTRGYSTARIGQLLAQLGYLPLTWTPSTASGTAASTTAASLGPASTSATRTTAAGQSVSGTAAGTSAGSVLAQRAAAFAPPGGIFTWERGYPDRLRAFWRRGASDSLMLRGAVMAFEADHGLAMDGVAGPQVWGALFAAGAASQHSAHGYTYAVASQKLPETLTIWHNGRVVLRNLSNTGIAVAPTTVATNPVYLRYRFQTMKGTNPDGTKYADPVEFVAYFLAGQAVHYFPRASYGSQQSLGCVELPLTAAAKAWPYLTYGTLVTVTAS